MLLQHHIELVDLGLQGSARQPKEDDAGVRQALVEDQLAEIAIRNYQDALLVAGNRKDILISKAMRVILGDSRDVVTKLTKMRNEAKVSALVEEELNTSGASETARFGGFGETSSPVTIALA